MLDFKMAAILYLFSAITQELKQIETFCLWLYPHFHVRGITSYPLEATTMVAILDFKMAATLYLF